MIMTGGEIGEMTMGAIWMGWIGVMSPGEVSPGEVRFVPGADASPGD